MIRRRHALLVLLAAVGFLLAYPPFHLLFPSFVALVPVVRLLRDAEHEAWTTRYVWKVGFWFGLALNGITLYWMVFALWRFTPLAALGYVATVVSFGALLGLFFVSVVWVRRAWPTVPLLVALPTMWTAGEWTIGHLPQVGFPWLGLGTSLAAFPALAQTAEWWGARGLTFLLVLANVALAALVLPEASKRQRLRAPLFVAMGIAAAAVFGAWREQSLVTRPVGTLALIQPNIGFDEKWTAEPETVMSRMLTLSEEALAAGEPAMVVWPEAAVPGYLKVRPDWAARIEVLAKRSSSDFVVGGLDVDWRGEGDYDVFNAAFFFSPDASWNAYPAYRKHYLVPITERVPFVNPRWFGGLRFFGAFERGQDFPVFESTLGRFGVFICYESTFEDVARRYRRAGADFLVTVTNDAWFGRTAAPYQHASHLVLRAIEIRAGIARAANSGISGFVDALGRYTHRTELDTEAIVRGTLETSDVITVYVRLGDWVGWLCVLASVTLTGGALVSKWRDRSAA